MYPTSLAISINTARPCPNGKWEEIKDAKHERKQAREREAKQMKADGSWNPSFGNPARWDERHHKRQLALRKKAETSSNGSSTPDPSTSAD